MPKIQFDNTEFGTVEGLPAINTDAKNFDVVQLAGKNIQQLSKQKGKMVVLNILPNAISNSVETNQKCDEATAYSMNILNNIFNNNGVCLFHIMSSGHLSFNLMQSGFDHFSVLINSEKFAQNFGLKITKNDNNESKPTTNNKKNKEILLARAIVVINNDGKIIYHELVQDLCMLPNFKACFDATQGILPEQESPKHQQIKLKVDAKDKSEIFYDKFWHNELLLKEMLVLHSTTEDENAYSECNKDKDGNEFKARKFWHDNNKIYGQTMLIQANLKSDVNAYTKYLKDKQCLELRSRLNTELDKENNTRPVPQHTKIREIIYNEIIICGQEYSNLLQKIESSSHPFFSKSENKENDEQNNIKKLESEKELTIEKLNELKNVFSLFGKTHEKIGKIEERFQAIADKLSKWLNGATLFSEILENPDNIDRFCNEIILLIARKIINHSLTRQLFLDIIQQTINECFEECIQLDEGDGSKEFQHFYTALKNPDQNKILFDELYNHISTMFNEDGFINEICMNPKLLSIETVLPQIDKTPSSTKSDMSVSSEIANSLKLLPIEENVDSSVHTDNNIQVLNKEKNLKI